MDKSLRILVVGEAPGHGGGRPIEGRIGRRLAKLADISFEEFLSQIDRVNLLKQQRRQMVELDRRAASRISSSRSNRFVVLLGRRVAKAFLLSDLPWFQPTVLDHRVWMTMPHPSGLNRWWNDRKNTALASWTLQILFNKELLP